MPPCSPWHDQQIRHSLRQAGQQAQQMAQKQFEINLKGPDDFVTSIDRSLDQQLTSNFTAWFPEDGLITEENQASVQLFQQHWSRFWLIDPLDGTDDLIQGRSGYAVMAGLLENYQPLAGWIYSPSRDRTYFGGPNWGLFEATGNAEPQALHTHPPAAPSVDFCPIMIGYKDKRIYGPALSQVIPEAQFHCLGSFGLKVLEVIYGRVGLYFYLNRRVKLWDTTGPLALAKAAGLVCCDISGQPLRFSPDAVETDSLAHRQTIVVGWPSYVELLRPRLQEVISLTHANQA
ncbi:MAG: inositol monophosphatase family protein [Aphanocapsa sp. GSE-SYN-MK-11-07L]|nr:inositol monophosphatase family protein [Aphanocapsa sp. GSE-SYN-MK-11-07L]